MPTSEFTNWARNITIFFIEQNMTKQNTVEMPKRSKKKQIVIYVYLNLHIAMGMPF